mmetsp:Transcript_39692/g.78187  ORF Transcript_39692/g.78187 Transcript_39692/m.78187 type:complete len:293 (-) Transcript_39692:250-1128(-)
MQASRDTDTHAHPFTRSLSLTHDLFIHSSFIIIILLLPKPTLPLLASSILTQVIHPPVCDSVLCLCLWKGGRVEHLHLPRVPPSLLQKQTRLAGVGHDVPPDRLQHVPRVHRHRVGGRDHLIRDHHSTPENVGQSLEDPQKPPEFLLTLVQFPSACVLCPEKCRGGVDNHQRVTMTNHRACRLNEQLQLVFAVVRPGNHDVVQRSLRVQVEPLGDGNDATGTEGVLCIDPKTLPFSPVGLERKLTSHSQRVTELGLPGSKLANKLSDTACLYPTLKKCVNGCGTCLEFDHIL